MAIMAKTLPFPTKLCHCRGPTRARQAVKTIHFAARRGSLTRIKVRGNPTPRNTVRNSSALGSKQMEKVNGTASLRLLP